MKSNNLDDDDIRIPLRRGVCEHCGEDAMLVHIITTRRDNGKHAWCCGDCVRELLGEDE